MRVVRQHAAGGPDVLRVDEVDVPRPGPGELLVSVVAAGVSWPQVRATRTTSGPFPLAPGGEVSGTVAATGSGTDGWAVGMRVVSIAPSGAYADYAIVPAALASPVPSSVGDAQAVSLLRNGHVALGALRMGCLEADDTVLITSAAGGVGHLAVQLARCLGAKRTIGAVGEPAKADFLLELGVDEVVSYSADAGPWPADVDLALDGAGHPALGRAVTSLARFGRLVTYSAVGGAVEANELRSRSASLIGFSIGHLAARSPRRYAEDGDQLWRLVADKELTCAVHAELPLTDADEAHRMLESREPLGKVVLRP